MCHPGLQGNLWLGGGACRTVGEGEGTLLRNLILLGAECHIRYSGTMIHLAVDTFFFLSLCTEGLVSAAGYGGITTMGLNSPGIRAAYVYKLTERGIRFVETMATAGNLEAL